MSQLRLASALGSNLETQMPDTLVSHLHLTEENERLNAEVIRLRERLIELERAADTDPLVNVYNRRAFVRELERARAIHKRYEIVSSVIYFDLNDFKAVNDRFGHNIGDQLLRKVGHSLTSNIRECDLAARLGGDEFGVLLFKTDCDIARVKADALACHIASQEVHLPTGSVSVSAAWGVAPCDSETNLSQTLSCADKAMYQSKNRGRA